MSSIFPDVVNPANIAYAQFQAYEETAVQKQIVLYRDLYEGDLATALVAELNRSLLSGDASKIPSAWNYFETVIDEVLGRLGVVNLTATPPSHQKMQQANTGEAGVFMEPGEEEDPGLMMQAEESVQWAMDWWQRVNMDEKQHDLFEYMLVDGEAFIILQPEAIGPDEFDVVPYVQRRYTDARSGGDNAGCKMHYRDGRQIMASKRWIEEYTEFSDNGRGQVDIKQENYMTLYVLPEYNEQGEQIRGGEIVKYKREAGTLSVTDQWDEIPGERKVWPWPLPIIHFRAPKNRSRGKNAAGPQILMDNYNVGLAVGASIASLPIMRVLGMYPTKDGEAPRSDEGNLWEVSAGAILGHPEHGPETAAVDWLRPGDLSQIISAIDQGLNHLAITTGTPALMSQKVRADAAAELIRRIEQRPITTARQAQIKCGNAFTQMFRALRVMLTEFAPEQPTEEGDVYPRWQTADTAVTAIAGTEEQPVVSGYEMNARERIEASK